MLIGWRIRVRLRVNLRANQKTRKRTWMFFSQTRFTSTSRHHITIIFVVVLIKIVPRWLLSMRTVWAWTKLLDWYYTGTIRLQYNLETFWFSIKAVFIFLLFVFRNGVKVKFKFRGQHWGQLGTFKFNLTLRLSLRFFIGTKRWKIYNTYQNIGEHVSKFTTPVLDWYSKKKIMNGICLFTNKLRFVHAKYHLEVLSSLLLAYLSFLYRLSQMCHNDS